MPKALDTLELWILLIPVLGAISVGLVIALRRAAKNGGGLGPMLGLRKTTARLVSERAATRFTDVLAPVASPFFVFRLAVP